MDGPGEILGGGGPEWVRTDSRLPVAGSMVFDSADIDTMRSTGELGPTIAHEMLHVIGFGSIWEDTGNQKPSAGCQYTGPKATEEYQKISGCNSIPIEEDGGDGTECGHWDEECLGTELMTGYSDLDVLNPLSRVTVGSLEDIGYTVDYKQAQEFTASDLNPSCVCQRRLEHGEMHFLRSSTREQDAPRRHRLSKEKQQKAVEHGLKILDARAAKGPPHKLPTGVEYVGDKVIAVLIHDDIGAVHGVLVRRAASRKNYRRGSK
jgi:hypothetical protein